LYIAEFSHIFGARMTLGWVVRRMTLVLGLGFVAHAEIPQAADCRQWRGPNRNGLSAETGLLQQWPSAGPAQVWSIASLGAGYGSLAVSGSSIFVQGSGNRA